jgi:glutamate-1-semialdehyde 2,1-aminomutase
MGLAGQASLEESKYWFERAQRALAGGISSSARDTRTGPFGFPLYISQGHGAHIWDADGNEFIDCLLGYGSAILGHGHPRQVEILKGQLDLGTMFGTCNVIEVQLAEQICAMVPCAELVRYANSGSEAIGAAVRGARGHTGRDKILKFEGHYHGWMDVLAVSNRPAPEEMGPLEAPTSQAHSIGIPAGVVSDVIVCPWNEPEILHRLLDRHEGTIAAVIAEPIVANNACIMPRPGYLETLREECTRRGIVLIFDEIVTGFRVAPGGAQALFGVKPDLAVYSKALGGGLPLSAVAGRREIMEKIARNEIRHGGTYNGNPLCAASALYTIQAIERGDLCRRIDEAGMLIVEALRGAAGRRGVPCVVQGLGAMFQIVFGLTARPTHYRDLLGADMNRFRAFRQALLEQGVHINSSGLACWFISAAHTPEDVDFIVQAVEKAMMPSAN